MDMARYLMGSEPVEILASGSCQIDKSIEVLPGSEAFDTANIIMRFPNGKEVTIDVCRQVTDAPKALSVLYMIFHHVRQ